MAAETAILVTIATSLASGLLKEVAKKAVDAASESSAVATSKYAIFGDLSLDLRLLEEKLGSLNGVLEIAQSIDAMHYDKNNLLLKWLKKVKKVACYADNLLDEIAYEKIRRKKHIEASTVAKLVTRSYKSFRFRMRIAGGIKEFSSLTAEIYKEADATLCLTQLMGTTSNQVRPPTVHENLRELRENPNTSIVMGRDADLKVVVDSLCSQHDHPVSPVLSVVAIVGRSGVGKTTLARMVYDDEIVKEYFGRRIWIFVSDNFKLSRFLDEMLQAITGKIHGLTNTIAMEDLLKQCLQEEKNDYLLVLDDVWNTDEQLWESVQSALIRISDPIKCKVLVTTQSSHVARTMRASPSRELMDLDDCDAWALFKKLAFSNKTEEQSSELEGVGRSILSKCKGLPLAVKTMGSLLASINEKSVWESVERSETWDLSLEQSKIMPWLLISFHHLRDASIKQCFVHCSIIIEKGQTVQQSDLIQAWMAQGFVQSSSTGRDMRIEDIAKNHVSYLVDNGLLQVFMVSNYECFKMHDLVHDMACYISKDTIWISHKACDLHTATKAEHIRISDEVSSVSVFNLPKDKTLSKLRTLICTRAALCIDFGAQTKFLRDLRLVDCNLMEVPSSIGKLKHLRYLSLRGNPFRFLPESVGKLFNLHALDLTECYYFHQLPLACEKLDNLREIMMPKTIMVSNNLSCVEIIPRHQFAAEKGFELIDWTTLEFVGGDAKISGLHLIKCNYMEALSLRAKKRIKKLFLKWGPLELQVADDDDGSNDEGVMDGLHPHSNLKEIHVDGFGGKRLSSWILHMSNLKTIVLKSCNRCEQLPALGQLASLKKFEIDGMESIEVIGAEFYQNNEGRASTSSDMSRDGILFPQLKSLCLRNMQKLREWVDPSGEYEQLFPKLWKLEIIDCPLLSSAPASFSSISQLHNLDIDDITLFQPHFLAGIYILSLRGNSIYMSIPEWMSCLLELRYLRIGGFNEELVELDGAAYLPKSLRYLELDGWPKLKCIPSELQTLKQLECLIISEFEELESLPEWIDNLSFLGFLIIKKCKNLKNLPSHEAMRRLTHLAFVDISDCPILEKMCREDEGKDWNYNEDDKVWRRFYLFH